MTAGIEDTQSLSRAKSICGRAQTIRRRLEVSPSLWILGILSLLIIVFGVTLGSQFFSVANLRNILVDASILLVLAVGETFITIAAGIDLSCGAILVFSGVLSGKVVVALGSPLAAAPAAVAVGVCSGALWGCLNGVLVAKAKLSAFIVTLGTMGMALGLAFVITGGVDQTNVPTWLINGIGVGNVFGVPWVSIISLAIALIFGLLLWQTRFGRYTYAAGSNLEAARRAGISIDIHLIKVYSLAGALYGVAGSSTWRTLRRRLSPVTIQTI